MKIIVDGHGGDNAPVEILKGCAAAVQKFDVEILVCGREEELRAVLREQNLPENGLSFQNTTEVVDFHDDPASVVKKKPDSSMMVGLRLLKEGAGDAFVCAGNTGALLSGATLIVRRIKGISRAALAPVLPSDTGPFLLIDAGANVEVHPEYLQQFGLMGSVYMEKLMKVSNPRVGLLNVGSEESKGTETYRMAYGLLKSSGLNFVGNVEGREAPAGACDVLVCDGFAGNVLLKTFEGVGLTMMKNIKAIFKKSALTKCAALLVKDGLLEFKKKMDYHEYGGALLMGIGKPVIKAHGSSDQKAFCAAIGQAVSFVNGNVIPTIEEELGRQERKTQG